MLKKRIRLVVEELDHLRKCVIGKDNAGQDAVTALDRFGLHEELTDDLRLRRVNREQVTPDALYHLVPLAEVGRRLRNGQVGVLAALSWVSESISVRFKGSVRSVYVLKYADSVALR